MTLADGNMFLFATDGSMPLTFIFDGYLLISQGPKVKMNCYCNFEPFVYSDNVYSFDSEFENLFAYDINEAKWNIIKTK